MPKVPFQPIVTKTGNTLNDKGVQIKGTNDFGRNSERIP